MRASCRTCVIARIGVLVVLGLTAIGCEAPNSLTIADSLPAAPAERQLRGAVVMLPPCALPARDETPGAPGPIVWRAASGPPTAEPQDDRSVIVPVTRDVPAISHGKIPLPAQNDMPRELNKMTVPPYRVEPSDVLLINVPRVVPRPTYKIEPLDQLEVQEPEEQLAKGAPVNAIYTVGADRQVNLGPVNGRVTVADLTLEQAATVIGEHLAAVHKLPRPPAIGVTLVPVQAIAGPHLLRMDGTVSLGLYGDVYLAGLTLAEAKQTIEAQLGQAQLDARVAVDVLGYNSKVIYVIYDGGGAGQQVITLPYQGGETVLDAISRAARGLPIHCSTNRIWVARPVPEQLGCRHVMPVDWEAITEVGATTTNYMLLPGDRVYVKADCMAAFCNRVSKMLAPFQKGFPHP